MEKVWSKLFQLKWVGIVVVFWVTLGIYLRTLTPTVPFWDSGEFIATSYILGIPHPPGTPLYVMIGRLFTLVPIATIAQRVNVVSTLMSTVAVCLMFLITWKLLVRSLGRAPEPREKLMILAGAAAAAFFLAFSESFWDNAIEAEAYAGASLAQALAVWMTLRWADGVKRGKGDALLLAIVYVLAVAGLGIHLGSVLVVPAIFLFVLLTNHRSVLNRRFAGLALAAVLIGGSVTLYLIIRANQNPAINEADPRTWGALWKELNREQYGQGSIFYILTHRKAPFGYQLDHMFWRYLKAEFDLVPPGSPGLLRAVGVYLPLLLGFGGFLWHAGRDRKAWWMMFLIGVITSLGLVVYLNFSDHEVRERAYFFTFFFQFFAVWIGLGITAVLFWVERVAAGAPAAAPAGAPARASLLPLVAALPLPLLGLLPANVHWRTHDRANFWVAHDYAYNMLAPLPRDTVLFTNGDNDTFPLWYIQAVENVRPDVRVANLSLLQTPWYIRQLKHLPPRVPFSWSDQEIEALRPYMRPTGEIVLVNDVAVRNIVETNQWKRPIYMAVTVPDHAGLDSQLVLEGLNYRVDPRPGSPQRVDLAATARALGMFEWRGILNKDGTRDTLTYKDENASHLTENYAATYVQAAFEHRSRRDAALARGDRAGADAAMRAALALMARAAFLSPDYPGVVGYQGILLEETGRIREAETHYRAMLARHPDVPMLYQRLGYLLVRTGREAEGLAVWQRGDPVARDFKPLFQTWASWLQEKGRYREVVDVLNRWLAYHPDDREWAAILQSVERYAGSAGSGTPGTRAAPGALDRRTGP